MFPYFFNVIIYNNIKYDCMHTNFENYIIKDMAEDLFAHREMPKDNGVSYAGICQDLEKLVHSSSVTIFYSGEENFT